MSWCGWPASSVPCAASGTGDHPLSRIALESGFRSAHYPDFGRFAGVTHSAFRASISDLTASFIGNPEGDAPALGLAD
jgi:hypothetical protein